MRATIEARGSSGNGLPDVGDYVRGDDGELYRVTSFTGSVETSTRASGGGDWVRATVEPADWEDCPEAEEHPARAVLGEWRAVGMGLV